MSDAEAEIVEGRRISMVWSVPILALLIGIALIVYTFTSQGPEISIRFMDAQGIEAGKTKIKVLNLEVGIVETATLSSELDRVVVTARIDPGAAPLLRDDTQFWVVRPRIGRGGISGLGTLLAGGHIELSPGTGPPGRRDFLALEEPPVTQAGTPGMRIQLVSERSGSVGPGDPVLYQGFRVGRVESVRFDVERHEAQHRIFIEAPYDELVDSNTRFWNSGGFTLSATADGVEVRTESLEALLIGGVALGRPTAVGPGLPVEDDATFRLYPDLKSVEEQPYVHGLQYVALFDQSVRGLQPGAPVEYRGIPAGRVERVLLEDFAAGIAGQDDQVPVLIRIEPGPQGLPDTEEGSVRLAAIVETAVGNGLRVSLTTGNIVTGSLYVNLDMHPETAPEAMGRYGDYPTIPTVGGGLAGIETRIAAVLDKVNALPIEDTVAGLNSTLVELDAFFASEELQGLPASLEATLLELRGALAALQPDSELQDRTMGAIAELDRTLQTMRQLLETLEAQPNAVIFSRQPPDDPRPVVGAP